jgi:hypothetical protein
MSELLTTLRLIPNGHPRAFARIVDNLCRETRQTPTFVSLLLAWARPGRGSGSRAGGSASRARRPERPWRPNSRNETISGIRRAAL